MLDIIKAIWEILKGRNNAEMAKISAYLLAPGLLLGLSFSGIFGGGLAIDTERPLAISELKTQINKEGTPESKRGVVLIAEPISSEYRIQLGTDTSRIWSSLDEETARANASHLVIDSSGGLNGKTPFIGVNSPVTIVVEGDLNNDIKIPGGTERVENLLLYSRRSNSIVSSVLLVCVFALGMSLATGLPSIDSNKDTAS